MRHAYPRASPTKEQTTCIGILCARQALQRAFHECDHLIEQRFEHSMPHYCKTGRLYHDEDDDDDDEEDDDEHEREHEHDDDDDDEDDEDEDGE